MLYALQCMEPTVFNWCESMLVCLKKQLTKCRRVTLKQLGYGAMVVSFILKWIPHLRPQVTITRLEPEDTRMLAWVTAMPRLGGATPKVRYGFGFFHWLRNQFLMIEDYANDGVDFCHDPELVLPEGDMWDDHGK